IRFDKNIIEKLDGGTHGSRRTVGHCQTRRQPYPFPILLRPDQFARVVIAWFRSCGRVRRSSGGQNRADGEQTYNQVSHFYVHQLYTRFSYCTDLTLYTRSIISKEFTDDEMLTCSMSASRGGLVRFRT